MKDKFDAQFEPNNEINPEVDLSRYIHKNIAEKYDFVHNKNENKSPFRTFNNEMILNNRASRGRKTGTFVRSDMTSVRPTQNDSSESPIPGDLSDRSLH